MKLKKLLLLLLISVLVLMPVAGCDGKEYKAIELVPEGADMIAGIKVGEAISAWQLYSATEEGTDISGRVEEVMSEFTDQTGMDPGDILEVVIFTDMSAMETEEYSGLIMTGNFDDEDLVDRIVEKTGTDFTADKYCGYTYYVASNDEGAFMILNDQMAIAGSVDAVRDCIDVIAGKIEKISGEVLETYNSLGDVVVRLALVVPEEAKEALAEEPGEAMMPVAMEPFEDMQTVGLALDLNEWVMTLKVDAGFSSPESAGKAAEALETMIDFYALMSPDEETAELVERIEITSSGSRMQILFEMGLLELAELAESYTGERGMAPMPFVPPDIEDFPDSD